MKIREKLAIRLNDEFGLSVAPDDFIRTFASKYYKDRGAFLWMFVNNKSMCIIGGCDPASKYVIKRNRLEIKESRFREYSVCVYVPGEERYDDIKINTNFNRIVARTHQY